MKPTRTPLLRAATASAMALIASQSLQAAGGSWNVDSAGNWNDTTKWAVAAVPGTAAGDVVNLQFNITAARIITINTTVTVGDLNIGDPTATLASYTLAGTTALTLDGLNATDATVDFTAAIANTISAPITLVDNAVFRSNVNAVMTLSNVISGSLKTVTFNNDTNGTVNAAGASLGQFLVSGNNTYSGGTSISDVRVQVGTNATALGSGNVTIASGGQVYCAAALTLANTFSIAGNGWAEAAANNPFGALRLETGATVSGNVNMTANAAIGNNTGTGTVSGVISGGFNLSKRGGGRINLSGTNTYTGTTSVVLGTLAATKPAALPGINTLHKITVANGSTLAAFVGGAGEFTSADLDSLRSKVDFNTGSLLGLDSSNAPSGTFTYGSNITDASGVAGTLGINKLGSTVVVLSGTNTYTGVTTVSAGALSVASPASLPGYVTNGSYSVANGATLAVSNAFSDADVTSMLGTTNFVAGASLGFDTSSGDRTYAAVLANTAQGALGLGKVGANTLTVSGANTYTGNTTVYGGTLNITGSLNGLAASTNLAYGEIAGNTIVNISGSGSINNYKNFTGANVAGSIAVMNQTGGSASTLGTAGGDTQWVAQNGGYGFLNITGGTFNTGRFDAVGITGGGTAVVYVGGAGTFNNNSSDWLILPRTNGTGEITVGPGGSLVRGPAVTAQLAITMNGTNSRGTVNIAGGNLDSGLRAIQFGFATPGSGNKGFVNLAGGTLSVGLAVNETGTAGSTDAYFNFAGGTLKMNASLASFIPATSITAHTITSTIFGPITNNNNANTAFNTQIGTTSNFTGGLTVDTNGFTTTFTNVFKAATGFGVTQANIGNISSLAGNSGYIGAPAVTFSNPLASGADPASGYAVIDSATGKVTGIVITNPGVYASSETPTITLTGGGGTIAPFATTALSTANTSGGLTKKGADELILTGNSTYTGLTTVSEGTLTVSGAGNLSASSGLAVSSAATFSYLPTVQGTPLTFGAGSTLDLANNSTIAATFGSTIAVSGAATTSGTVNLALSGIFTSGNSYSVLTAASGLNTATYKVLNAADFTYITTVTATGVSIIPTAATPLSTAYWLGGYAGQTGVWSVSDGSSPNNWTTNGTGTGTALVPGANTDVFFSDAAASPANQIGMSLGSDMTVKSLTFNSANPVSLLNTDVSVLTIGNGLTVNPSSGSVTLSANLAISSAQTWTNNSSNTLTTGLVSNGANLLTITGGGNTTIGNFVGGTGGLTVASGSTTLTAATLAGAQTWTNNSLNNLTVGAINNAGFALTLAGSGDSSLNGVISGAGTLTKSGPGTATLTAANTYTGATTIAEGTLTLSGARTVANGAFTLGTAGLNTTLNISNGTYAMGGNRFNVGNSSTTAATATVNQTGGAVSFTSSDELLIGQNTVGNQGVYNLSGGSITTYTSTTRGIMLGVNTNPNPGPTSGGGTFNLSGTGSINMTAASGAPGDGLLQIGRSDAVANNTTNLFNQSGGTANVGILAIGGAAAGSTGVNSTLTLTGGTFSANSFTVLAAGDSNTATINIGGTANVTLPAFPTARGVSSTATLTLDGGTLRPSAASATYLSGLTNAFIKAGGANFDVPTARDITVSQDLLTDTVSTGGGLAKSGVGKLTLSGTNTYTGATTVSAGTLTATKLLSLPGQSTPHKISVAASATLAANVGGTGEFASADIDNLLAKADYNTGASLGLDTTNAAGGTFTYASAITNASAVAGTSLGFTKLGANTLVLSGTNTYSGPTTITAGVLQIGSLNNLGDAAPTNSLNLAGGTLSAGSSTVTLDTSRTVSITAATGFRSETGGTLTIATDLANGANALAFTGAGNIIVNGVIGTGATPTGAITIGSSTLPANVTLSGNNLFTGNVTLPASNIQPFAVLTVTNSGALGVGPKTVQATGGGEIHLQNNITLAANLSFTTSGSAQQNGVAGVNRPVIVNDSGSNTINGNITMASGNGATIIESVAGQLTLNGNLAPNTSGRQLQVRGNGNGVINGVIANGSTVNMPVLKDGGTGTWTFNSANTYTGVTTVSAGTLQLGNAAALGTGAATVATGGALDLGGQTIANAVNVNAGGTLSGSGTLSTAATLSGSVTPGGSGSGLITLASATVASTANLAFQLAGTGTRGTAYDALTVNSALALNGTITVTLNGLTPAGGQSFDLIDSTGAINVTNFDVPTKLVLPTLGAGLAWNTSTFATDGVISIVSTDPFATWQGTKFTPEELGDALISGPDADPDKDGISNKLEYAFGLEPKTGNLDPKYRGEASNNAGALTLTYRRPTAIPAGLTAASYVVQFKTDDLVTGNPANSWTDAVLGTHYTESVSSSGGVDTITINFTGTVSGKKFARISVTY